MNIEILKYKKNGLVTFNLDGITYHAGEEANGDITLSLGSPLRQSHKVPDIHLILTELKGVVADFVEGEKSLVDLYPAYYKDVSDLKSIDIYRIHHRYNIQDPSGCVQHSSKKLLLSGGRTGGKPAWKDIKEARDTLTVWLQINGYEVDPCKLSSRTCSRAKIKSSLSASRV